MNLLNHLFHIAFLKRKLAVMLLSLTAASSAVGHHGNVIFDLNRVVTLQGTVSSYVWRNPHVYLYINAADASGAIREWQLEADPTPLMSRSGWGPTSFEPGERVAARINPDRDENTAHGLIVSVMKPDGLVLTPRSGGRAATEGATSIAGLWDGLRDFKTRRFIYGELTPEGIAARDSYTEADNPVIDCVPFPLPTIVAAPYLYEISILEDRIRVRTELFNVERNFYTDGRPHPESADPTTQGHSIAWWEDKVLVVDTVNYDYNRAGNRSGIPGSTQKHSVERYQLTEDGKQLKIDYVIDDPVYMVEPMTGGIVLDYAPDRELMPFECNQSNARLYDVQ